MARPRGRIGRLSGLRALLAAGLGLWLSGCSAMAYYGHLIKGQTEVLSARTPIAEVVADPETDATLRARLQRVDQARGFAVAQLALPESGSYRSYVELDRRYVLWNVFAAPEFSMQAYQWCNWLYGCFAYRGYYRHARAQREATRLNAQGMDTHIGGVPAYSTLGWFDDPLLWSMMYWDDHTLLETLFHELAHERLFLKGDTAFNESYASFVGEEGLRQWAASRGLPPPSAAVQRQRRNAFVALVEDARQQLETLYNRPLSIDAMRSRKAEFIEALRARYRRLRDTEWEGWGGYDHWFEAPINNAKLLTIGLYHQWVPAFAALFAEVDEDWSAFHAAVEALADAPPEERRNRLEQLAGQQSGARAPR